MGERKGQNLYYPPDYDPRVGGLNKFQGTHALRERARKLHMGILIIRFEMPYNIWCDGCNNHIGMGVRYNAEKTKIGMYYTTPVYQFRMKCHLCDNHFEIKTDPGNLDYVIVSGARRQENRWDPTQNEQIVPETKETQKRLFDDPMFKLEHKSEDVQTMKDAKPRIGKLVMRNDNVWRDNYEANSMLRRQFRKKSKELQISNQNDSALLKKSSLDIMLLPETEEDRKMASLLSLKPAFSIDERQTSIRNNIINSNVLPSSSGLITSFGGLKKEKLLSQTKQLTRSSLGIAIKSSNVKTVSETCVKSKTDNKQESDEQTDVESKIISADHEGVLENHGKTKEIISTNFNANDVIKMDTNIESKQLVSTDKKDLEVIKTVDNEEKKGDEGFATIKDENSRDEVAVEVVKPDISDFKEINVALCSDSHSNVYDKGNLERSEENCGEENPSTLESKVGVKRKCEKNEVEVKKSFILCDYDSTSEDSNR